MILYFYYVGRRGHTKVHSLEVRDFPQLNHLTILLALLGYMGIRLIKFFTVLELAKYNRVASRCSASLCLPSTEITHRRTQLVLSASWELKSGLQD